MKSQRIDEKTPLAPFLDAVRTATRSPSLDGACNWEVAQVAAWGPRERRHIPLADGSVVRIAHDEREAPLAPERPELLMSLTDEDDVAVCAWSPCAPESRVVGIGIDLASVNDFAGVRGESFNRLIFSPHERDFVAQHYAGRPEYGFALAFAAKEAAFKACAAPLRAWYTAHDEELLFDLREFELVDACHVRGTLRKANAQRALGLMGVAEVRLSHAELPGAVLALARCLR